MTDVPSDASIGAAATGRSAVERRQAESTQHEPAAGELSEAIASLDLTPTQRHYLRTRYAGQVEWMEGKAKRAQRWYVWLRLATIIGALIVPVLIGLTPSDDGLQDAIRIATVVVGLIVAISAAVEQFFHYGGRWQHYRRTVERLKTEGWRYFQLIDDYRVTGTDHATQFPRFARRVEDLLQEESDVYLREVVAERREDRAAAEQPVQAP